MRGFEPVREEFRQNEEYYMPKRSTKASAGYDFATPVRIVLHPHEHSRIIPTDIKVSMGEDEFLACHVRSSLGMKKGISLTNITGIIDSDYYSNPDNDGNICFQLKNNSEHTVIIEKGEKVFQGIFQKYLKTDSDEINSKRTGGIGSTGEKERITIDISKYRDEVLNECRNGLHEPLRRVDESLTDAITDHILSEDWKAEDFDILIKDNTLEVKCNIDGVVTKVVKCKEDVFDLEKAVMMALLKQFDVNYGLVDKIIKNSPYPREGKKVYYAGINPYGGYCVKECIWKWEYIEEFSPLFYGNVYKTREEAEKRIRRIKELKSRLKAD